MDGGHFRLKPDGRGVVVRGVDGIFDDTKALVDEIHRINMIPMRRLATQPICRLYGVPSWHRTWPCIFFHQRAAVMGAFGPTKWCLSSLTQ